MVPLADRVHSVALVAPMAARPAARAMLAASTAELR
jgi:hypothetical protein